MKRKLLLSLVLAVFIATLGLSLTGCGLFKGPDCPLCGGGDELPSSLPTVHVGIPLEDITHHRHGGGWQRTTLSVVDVCGTVLMEDHQYVSIRGRGNSSWWTPKRPFRLRFEHAYCPITHTRIPGSRYQYMLDSTFSARNWTFIASFADKSLMRNYSAYWLARQMMDFAPNTWFVNVYTNGVYQGVYMMSDQISEVTEGRVNLTQNSDPALSEYLIELCGRAPDEGVEWVDWVRAAGRSYNVEFGATTRAHFDYVVNFIENVDSAIQSQDWDRIQQWIDVDSFINFYLVQELFKNTDVGGLSVFKTIRGTGADRRLHMGPVWDFDIGAGNTYYIPHGPEGVWAAQANTWFRRLMRVDEYRDMVAERWFEIRPTYVVGMFAMIRRTVNTHWISFERNFVRWPILGIYTWPNPPHVAEIDTFLGQVDFLVDFLTQRATWMDGFLANN